MQYLSDDSIPLPLREARQALKDQLKDADVMSRVARAASAALQAHRDSFGVRELVADVVGDTYSGSLAWDPSTPMGNHLIGELRRRVSRSRRAMRDLVPLTSLADEEVPSVEDHEADAEADAKADARLAQFERDLPDLLGMFGRKLDYAFSMCQLYERGYKKAVDLWIRARRLWTGGGRRMSALHNSMLQGGAAHHPPTGA